MLVGVLSDKYIRENCWPQTAPLALGKRVGRPPVTIKASGNMRSDFTFQGSQPVITDLATNIIASTPKKNLPVNSDIVSYVSAGLVKTEAPSERVTLARTISNQNPLMVLPREEVPEGLMVPQSVLGLLPREVQAMVRSGMTSQIPSQSRPQGIYSSDPNNPFLTPARRGAFQRTPDLPAEPQPE